MRNDNSMFDPSEWITIAAVLTVIILMVVEEHFSILDMIEDKEHIEAKYEVCLKKKPEKLCRDIRKDDLRQGWERSND